MSKAKSNWWDDEHPITLGQAAKLYPCPTHPSTVYRHATKPNRYGIRLESFRCAGRRLTTKEAVARYFADCTDAANGVSTNLVSDSDRAAAAEAELDALL